MRRITLTFPAIALVLAGCMNNQASVAGAECSQGPAEGFIGQTATDATIEEARVAAGAQTARAVGPGDVVTMEFSASRLTLQVDNANVITGASCG
jgi:hypothetical protein